MEQSLEFLDETWPLVVVRLPTMMNNVKVVQTLIGHFDRAHSRNERFTVVADCSAVVKFPGRFERKMLTDWLAEEQRQKSVREHNLGTAIVLTSGPMRAFMSALNWVRRPSTPQVWKATTAEGVDWCCECLARARVPLTPAIEALRARRGRYSF